MNVRGEFCKERDLVNLKAVYSSHPMVPGLKISCKQRNSQEVIP